MSLSTLNVGRRIARFTDEELDRHEEASVCKSRGGSALLLGQRSPGRWDPACTCGWRNSSNGDKRSAVTTWREHRSTAVGEERRLAAGAPIYRVLVAWDADFAEPIREWRGVGSIEQNRSRAESEAGRNHARVERSTDGVTWEPVE